MPSGFQGVRALWFGGLGLGPEFCNFGCRGRAALTWLNRRPDSWGFMKTVFWDIFERVEGPDKSFFIPFQGGPWLKPYTLHP